MLQIKYDLLRQYTAYIWRPIKVHDTISILCKFLIVITTAHKCLNLVCSGQLFIYLAVQGAWQIKNEFEKFAKPRLYCLKISSLKQAIGMDMSPHWKKTQEGCTLISSRDLGSYWLWSTALFLAIIFSEWHESWRCRSILGPSTLYTVAGDYLHLYILWSRSVLHNSIL